jgi:hypothetical protein
MSGPKRNPDKLNTIGVVVVGICGAVLVYVTIVALQAFYMSNTSELQTMADYGGQDMTAKGRRADEMRNITEAGKNSVGEGQRPTFRIPIDVAMQKVVEDAKQNPAHLVPALPPSTKPSIEPVFGRPRPAGAAGAAAAGEAPQGEAPATGNQPEAGPATPGAGGAAPTGAGGQPAPMVPTGQPGMPQPTAGTGGVPTGDASPAGAQATGQPATGEAVKTRPQPKAQPKRPAPTEPAPAQPAPAPNNP